MDNSHLLDVADRLTKVLDARIPEPPKVDVRDNRDDYLTLPNGEVWVVRPQHAILSVTDRDLKDFGVELGSHKFMQLYIDQAAGLMANLLESCVAKTQVGPTIFTRRIKPVPPEAGVWSHGFWSHSFWWQGLPILLTSYFQDNVLKLRIDFYVAQLEHD